MVFLKSFAVNTDTGTSRLSHRGKQVNTRFLARQVDSKEAAPSVTEQLFSAVLTAFAVIVANAV
jgi:hypothetical protein